MKFSLELELIFLLHSTGKTTKPTLTEVENIALATKMDESCVFRLGQTRAYTDKILFAVGNGSGLLCYGPLDPRADLPPPSLSQVTEKV